MEIRDDGRIARDRCLGRMVNEQDLETRRSLWRAAVKFHAKMVASVSEGEVPTAGLTRTQPGERVYRVNCEG